MGKIKLRIEFLDMAREFFSSLPEKVQQKITYKDIFKKLEDTEIWEFRTLFNGTCYRFFAFWDTELEALVVATHGIVKKTQKTPKKEIKKAEAIRKEYFDDKNKQ